jgi:hypothetical protein
MKWFLNPCRRHRERLCLLASGLLMEQDRVGIENHLTQCADCRSYYEAITEVTSPLAGWEKHFAHFESGTTVYSHVLKAVALEARRKPVRAFAPKTVLRECWRQLVWPSRRIWAGLAAVWVLLLAANVSMRDSSQFTVAKTSPTPEIILSFQQQEKILAELIGPNETRAALPPKPFTPQPRSEQRFEMMTASIVGDDVRSL